MRPDLPCDICRNANHPLGSRTFYAFPCGHGMHCDCCLKVAAPFLTEEQRLRTRNLDERLGQLRVRVKDGDRRTSVLIETVQAELDTLVAAECPLCGELMIRSLAVSLTEAGAAESKSWDL